MRLLSAVAAVDETPADDYLAEQADLTAVERFAQRHETELTPRQARYYRDLLPTAQPLPGQQYAFEVDLDACTGCKACVAACHSLNGLDDGESWRAVTLLTGGVTRPVQQTVTAACHHCVDPACLAGCPVDAYEKDPLTGIVAHLDDQCIGCGYCTLTCPYEVPVLNHARGIVRKCDMCRGRLAVGEAPACVQACPNSAIAIAVVDVSTATAAARAPGEHVVPAAPPASITTPTTVYRTKKADVDALTAQAPIQSGPATAHTPLAVMLVLTQLAVGAFATDVVLRTVAGGAHGGPPRALDAAITLAAGVIALGASVLHLGRPMYCYRAVIGWRHSWLSREVVAFGAFTALAALHSLFVVLDLPAASSAMRVIEALALAAGLAGIACSVLIYTTTHRSSWRPVAVSAKFILTTAMCGASAVLSATLVASAAVGDRPTGVGWLEVAVVFAAAAQLAGTGAALAGSRVSTGEHGRRAHLMLGELRAMTTVRIAAGVAGGLLIPAALAVGGRAWPWGLGGLALAGTAGVLVAELAERSLFFTTASPPR